jgi:predicted RNA-binding Zn-ribbon protein involved in translation (DUF1610 family)
MFDINELKSVLTKVEGVTDVDELHKVINTLGGVVESLIEVANMGQALVEAFSSSLTPTAPSEVHSKCPRCNEVVDMKYPALSRVDNETFVCSPCGTEEAMQNFQGIPLTPLTA